jgi:hypothetical protein
VSGVAGIAPATPATAMLHQCSRPLPRPVSPRHCRRKQRRRYRWHLALIEASSRVFVSALRRWGLNVSSRSRALPRRQEERCNEVPELRHGREYRAARAAYDVFIIRWAMWINDRLRGKARTGKFFGHGISQEPLIHAAGGGGARSGLLAPAENNTGRNFLCALPHTTWGTVTIISSDKGISPRGRAHPRARGPRIALRTPPLRAAAWPRMAAVRSARRRNGPIAKLVRRLGWPTC